MGTTFWAAANMLRDPPKMLQITLSSLSHTLLLRMYCTCAGAAHSGNPQHCKICRSLWFSPYKNMKLLADKMDGCFVYYITKI